MGMVTYGIGGGPESQGSKFEHAKRCSSGGSGVTRVRKSLGGRDMNAWIRG